MTITSTPIDDLASRIRLEIDLVKLMIRFEAMESTGIGESRQGYIKDYQSAREALFRNFSAVGRLPLL